ncbi:helix-turn-helix domain-containing protein [Streptomyces sp. NPDC051051]|uniref:helix-turn-helix domain-containing protein n=1 Tax=Streptomyces sp. NPDC051051 TaxID=3155666 RepID=UPI00344190C5
MLESATGATNKDVADRLGIEAHAVSRWRARFVRDRLEGLTDEPRPVDRGRSPTTRSRKWSSRRWRPRRRTPQRPGRGQEGP